MKNTTPIARYESAQIYKGFPCFFTIHENGYQPCIVNPHEEAPVPEDLAVFPTLELAQESARRWCDLQILIYQAYAKVENWRENDSLSSDQADELYKLIQSFNSLSVAPANNWDSSIPCPRFKMGQVVCTADPREMLHVGTIEEIRWEGLWEYFVHGCCFCEEDLFLPDPKHWMAPARHPYLDYEISIVQDAKDDDRFEYQIYSDLDILVASGTSIFHYVPAQVMYNAIKAARSLMAAEELVERQLAV